MKPVKDQRYGLFYKGPVLELEDTRLGEAANLISSVAPYTVAQARDRLSRSPFQIIGGLHHSQAVLMLKEFTDAGLAVEMQPVDYLLPLDSPRQAMPFRRIRGKYLSDGSGSAVLTELGPGLFLMAVLAMTGLLQILLAHTFLARQEPLWSLSATGWMTLGLSLVGLFILIMIKARPISEIIKAPNYNSPIDVIHSYVEAINSKHWLKAAACLAGDMDSNDLANKGFPVVKSYLKKLHTAYVIDTEIDPARVVTLSFKDGAAMLRLNLKLMSRKPQSEGSRVRYDMIHVLRCIELDGDWFILDAELMAQKDPDRLPVPSCSNCGKEIIFGQVSCESCQWSLPPYALENEQWISPRKKPDLAAMLSAFVPGLGQVYNGQVFKGIFIGASSWLVLPWLFGVIDASVIADRINRRRSLHEIPKNLGFTMGVYVVAFVMFIIGLVMNASSIPVISQILEARQELIVVNENQTVVSRFQGDDGNYSILFPFSWSIDIPEEPENAETGETVALHAYSEDGSSTLIISTRQGQPNWQPCPAAMEARRLLEEQMMEIANVDCGTIEGRKQYRLDSYSPDRKFRQSLSVISFRKELVVIAFVCPVEEQSDMVDIYDQVVTSIRQVESSNTTIKR